MSTPTQTRFLTKQDRCDKCSAAASVALKFNAGELMFCGHHLNQYSKALKKTDAPIVGWQEPPPDQIM